MGKKEENKKEHQNIEEKEQAEQMAEDREQPSVQYVQGQQNPQPGQDYGRQMPPGNQMPNGQPGQQYTGQMPNGQSGQQYTGQIPNGQPGRQYTGQMPQQPGPGNYGYQNPYRNNWQNQRYYGNDFGRTGAGGYNHYPNQNYGANYGSQGNAYDNRSGNYGAGYGMPQNTGGDSGKGGTGAGKKILITVGVCAALLLCVVGIYYGVRLMDDQVQEQQVSAQPENPQIAQVDLDAPAAAEENSEQSSQGALTDVSDLVERIMPSVVSVNAVYSYESSYWGEEKYDGGGSGFIIGENETELLIATNSHVVSDAEDLKVAFVDEATADARVKGHDNDLDVAVIAVRLEDISEETKKSIAVAKLGDSTTLRAGQAVISIGNALLLGQSVTTGIISATNAPVGGGYDEMGNQYGSDDRVMIQTTAIMNPGCSGGVLINSNGEVVGINTMTISAIDVEGMCYAIPITDAIPVLDKLKVREIRERLRESESGYLGISCTNVEGKQAEEYGIPNGVYVRSVDEGGAAEKAGLQKGDVIIALNEVPVKTMDELSEMLRYYAVDEIVDLEIMRYKEGEYLAQTISVKLGKK